MASLSVLHYFAYGSNMNPARVRARGLEVADLRGAYLTGLKLVFDKVSRQHPGAAHANIAYAPGERVEGVLYRLASAAEILKMDPFERAPWNYGRDAVLVRVPCPASAGKAQAATGPAPLSDGGALAARSECDAVAEASGDSVVPAWTYFANPAARRPGLKPPAEYLAHMLAGRDYLSADYFRWLARTEVAFATADSGPENA